MKPFKILVLLVCLTASQQAFAQTTPYQNEVYAEYGVLSAPLIGLSFSFALGNALGNAIVNGIVTNLGGTGVTYEERITGTGAIGLGYNRFSKPNGRFSFGLNGVFERVTDRLEFSNGNVGEYRVDAFTLMARTDFRWINKPGFKFYSGVAFGGSYYKGYDVDDNTNGDDDASIAFQVSPIGLRFGKQFGLFLEGGFGWNGLLVGGLSAKF